MDKRQCSSGAQLPLCGSSSRGPLEDSKVSLQEDALQVMVMARNWRQRRRIIPVSGLDLAAFSKIPDGTFPCPSRRQFPDAVNRAIPRDKLTVDYMTKLNARFNVNLERVCNLRPRFDTLFRKSSFLKT